MPPIDRLWKTRPLRQETPARKSVNSTGLYFAPLQLASVSPAHYKKLLAVLTGKGRGQTERAGRQLDGPAHGSAKKRSSFSKCPNLVPAIEAAKNFPSAVHLPQYFALQNCAVRESAGADPSHSPRLPRVKSAVVLTSRTVNLS